MNSFFLKERAQSELEENGVNPNHPNIFYYIVKHDNAWMRDNGPFPFFVLFCFLSFVFFLFYLSIFL